MTTNWQELLKEDREVVLFSADVDRIQDYVFESARLPEIRGASLLIEALNDEDEEIVRRLKNWVIFNGGGSLLAILPDMALAEQFKSDLERFFLESTGLVTITCVYHPTRSRRLRAGYLAEVTPEALWSLRRSDQVEAWRRVTAAYKQELSVAEDTFKQSVAAHFQQHNHFGQWVELMAILLKEAKDQRRNLTFYETLPQAQCCRSCGQRPAQQVGRYNDVAEEIWPFCAPCWQKVANRKDRRQAVLDHVRANLSPAYFGDLAFSDVDTANDLDDIGQTCRTRPGYVAFIYVDGDSIGSFMTSQRTPAEYEAASSALKSATREAIYGAIDQFLRPTCIKRKDINDEQGGEEEIYIHPFEIIAIGGDDGLLFVPADLALPLAISISRRFSQAIQASLGIELTLSAGVVIAPAHTPVRSLRNISYQLLKSAKRRAKATRSSQDRAQGGLDFLVLTSQSMLRRDLEDLRNTEPVRVPTEESGAYLRLTATPYTMAEMERLLGLLSLLRDAQFPTSQLQQLAIALREGRERGSLYFLYQQARLKNKPAGAVLTRLTQQWPFNAKSDPIPWQEIGPEDFDFKARYISMLPDLVDLYSFVPDRPELLTLWKSILKE